MNIQTRSPLILIAAALLFSVISTQSQAAKETFDRSKPHLSFVVSSPDMDMAGFRQLDGLGIDIEVIEYQDGDDLILRKRPGRLKYSNITLERPYKGATDIEQWAHQTGQREGVRRDLSLVILDRSALPIRTFSLLNCFPSNWTLTTNDKGGLVERLTLAVERIEAS
jgi:phage tail-like protein